MKLTADQHKDLAANYLRAVAVDPAHLIPTEPVDGADWDGDDFGAIVDLLRTADITVTWPDSAATAPAAADAGQA